MNIIYSPLSRHILYNYKHYIVFIIHDFSVAITLFIFVFFMEYTKKQNSFIYWKIFFNTINNYNRFWFLVNTL